jgi:hypothetical protein
LNKEKLNSLAEKARAGCQDSMWMIKWHFSSIVYEISERNRNKLRNTANFEEGCFQRIETAVLLLNSDKSSLETIVDRSIKRYLERETKKYKKQCRGVAIDYQFYRRDDEGNEVFPEIDDKLALVEENLLFKEKIAPLAGGDPKKVMILNQWTRGNLIDSSIATLLAQQYGGKAESYRRYVTRFKKECSKALA